VDVGGVGVLCEIGWDGKGRDGVGRDGPWKEVSEIDGWCVDRKFVV